MLKKKRSFAPDFNGKGGKQEKFTILLYILDNMPLL